MGPGDIIKDRLLVVEAEPLFQIASVISDVTQTKSSLRRQHALQSYVPGSGVAILPISAVRSRKKRRGCRVDKDNSLRVNGRLSQKVAGRRWVYKCVVMLGSLTT